MQIFSNKVLVITIQIINGKSSPLPTKNGKCLISGKISLEIPKTRQFTDESLKINDKNEWGKK